MGLTTALFTSLSGLNANSQAINVTGNNIANVNTTAFKSSRAAFETQISETLSSGTAPTASQGGTNQSQIGLGTKIGSVARNQLDGSLQVTGSQTDLAIEGDGFFAVNVDGKTLYTRAGTFTKNSNSNLVTPDGGLLQGFGVDGDFNIIEGVVGNVSIPVGSLSFAEATELVTFSGELDPSGEIATQGSVQVSDPIFSDAGATTAAVASDSLASLFDVTGTPMFSLGDVVSVTGVTKGNVPIPDHTFEVGPTDTTGSDAFGTTLQDFMDFVEDILGIDTTVGGGVTVAGGAITVAGNIGVANGVELAGSNIVVNLGATPTQPFILNKTQDADGESIRTTFNVFDSLGSEVSLDLRVVFEASDNAGTSWRFFVDSEADSDVSTALGSGTLRFDNDGQLLAVTGDTMTLDRDGTGALSPQQFQLSFAHGGGAVRAGVGRDSSSQVTGEPFDGAALGTLEEFTIGRDGTIVGKFNNGKDRDLGRVVLASFVNPQGLVEVGSNLFDTNAASGAAGIKSPTVGGAGAVVSGALELSNVDLSQEFINLVIYSTGFSANSRVLTTSDQLIQELLATVR